MFDAPESLTLSIDSAPFRLTVDGRVSTAPSVPEIISSSSYAGASVYATVPDTTISLSSQRDSYALFSVANGELAVSPEFSSLPVSDTYKTFVFSNSPRVKSFILL